ICAAPHNQERTRSVQNGIPTRSMGTMVFLRATIVPHSNVGTPWVTLRVTDLRRAT
ncbi:hypothetical protein A233_22161, partial [Pseudomonas syringae pv. actinidiae ICMP 19097]